MTEEEINSNIGVKIKVEVFDRNGHLKSSTEKDSDLILDNFGIWLASVLAGGVPAGNPSYKDITGYLVNSDSFGSVPDLPTYGVFAGSGVLSFNLDAEFPGTLGFYGQIGTGLSAPIRSNFQLVAPVESIVAINNNSAYGGGS